MMLRQSPFLATALAEIECGVTIADPSIAGTPLIYANAAFERMTGYPRAEILGRNCRFLQGDLTDQPGLRTVRNAIARGTDCTTVVTNFRRNGEPFENRLKLRSLRTNDGAVRYSARFSNDPEGFVAGGCCGFCRWLGQSHRARYSI